MPLVYKCQVKTFLWDAESEMHLLGWKVCEGSTCQDDAKQFSKVVVLFYTLPAIDPQLNLVKLLNFAKLVGTESHLVEILVYFFVSLNEMSL